MSAHQQELFPAPPPAGPKAKRSSPRSMTVRESERQLSLAFRDPDAALIALGAWERRGIVAAVEEVETLTGGRAWAVMGPEVAA